jgi:hypothetical protein
MVDAFGLLFAQTEFLEHVDTLNLESEENLFILYPQ